MNGINEQIRRARQHDPDAWAVLWEVFGPTLLGLAQRLLGPSWPDRSVSDLLQTTWLRAFLGIADFRGGESDEQTAALFRAWLAIILRRASSNEARHERIRRVLRGGPAPNEAEVAGPGQPPSVAVMRAELQALVREAMERLPPPEREVLQLHLVEGLSDPAVAARLGITLHQTRYRREQALKEMKDRLEDRVGD